MIKDLLLDGKVPEVPFTIMVDDKTILKLSIAAIMVATIILLVSAVIKNK